MGIRLMIDILNYRPYNNGQNMIQSKICNVYVLFSTIFIWIFVTYMFCWSIFATIIYLKIEHLIDKQHNLLTACFTISFIKYYVWLGLVSLHIVMKELTNKETVMITHAEDTSNIISV